MHRHGYKQRKLSRPRGSRRLLIRSLAGDLIRRRSLTTTLPKAKSVLPFVERLITKAKQGGLHQRRQIIAKLGSASSAHLLVDRWAPQLKNRRSGHLRLEKLADRRRGDGASMARLAFVDQLAETLGEEKPVAAQPKPAPAKKAAAKPKATKPRPAKKAKTQKAAKKR